MSDTEITRILPDGRQISIVPMLFDKWRLHVGPAESLFFDDGW